MSETLGLSISTMETKINILDLPNELLIFIAKCLDDEFSVNALLQTCKRFPPLLNRLLYQLNVRYSHSCALEWAAKNGHEVAVRYSLEAGASPNAAYFESWLPMALACIHGHEAVVRLLLEHGVDPISDTMQAWLTQPEYDPQTDDEGSPLILAAANGHENVVKLLLSSGVPPDIRCEDIYGKEISPLSMAATNGHLSLVKLFVSLGADLRIEGLHDTIIADVSVGGHCEIARFLIETDPELFSSATYIHALNCAVAYGHFEIVETFLESEIIPNFTVKEGPGFLLPPLGRAAQKKDLQMAEKIRKHMSFAKLITSGEPDDDNHRQLLMICVACGWQDIVEALLQRGCSSDFPRPRSQVWIFRETLPNGKRDMLHTFDVSPLALAAYHGHRGIVDLLLNHNDNPAILEKLLNEREPNPLFAAIEGSHFSIAQALLDHGANPNSLNEQSVPVCSHALRAPKMLQLLLDSGLNLSLRATDQPHSTAASIMERALRTGNLATLDLLQQEHSFKKLQQTDDCHSIPFLQSAAESGASVLEYLLDSGYEVVPSSDEAKMTLELVLSRADIASLKVLFDRGLVEDSLVMSRRRVGDYKHSLLGLVDSPGVDKDRHAMSVTLDILMAHGCHISGQPSGGFPLFEAISQGFVSLDENLVLCQLLLERGADPLQRYNQFHQTPLAKVANLGHRKLVQAMLHTLDQRKIPLEELLVELNRAELEAEYGLKGQIPPKKDVRPLLRRFYWRKKYAMQ